MRARPLRVVAVALAAVLLTVAGAGCEGSRERAETPSRSDASTATTRTPTEQPTSSPSSSLLTATQLDDVPGVRTYDARPNPDWVVLAGGTAWVANVGHGVGRYDAHTGRPRGSVGTGMDICTAMVAGFGSLWAVDCPSRRLSRFDLATGRPQDTIQLPFDGIQEEGALAAGGGGVYVVAAGGSEIARIDPRTDRVAARFPAPVGAAGVRYGFGSLWVTSPGGETVARLDPRDGSLQATVGISIDAYFLDVGHGAVWVMANASSEVFRIDPRTEQVEATIDVSDTAVEGGDLAVGGDAVWARVSDVLVARIDPATNHVVDRLGVASGSGSVDADREAVWISAHDQFAVYRVPLAGRG